MEVAAAVKNGRNPQRFLSPEFSRETPSGDRKVRQNTTPSGPLSVGTSRLKLRALRASFHAVVGNSLLVGCEHCLHPVGVVVDDIEGAVLMPEDSVLNYPLAWLELVP